MCSGSLQWQLRSCGSLALRDCLLPRGTFCCRQAPHRASPSLDCHHLLWPRSPGHASPSDSLPSRSHCSRHTIRSCRQPQMPGVQNALPLTSHCRACAQRLQGLCWAATETGGLSSFEKPVHPIQQDNHCLPQELHVSCSCLLLILDMCSWVRRLGRWCPGGVSNTQLTGRHLPKGSQAEQ